VRLFVHPFKLINFLFILQLTFSYLGMLKRAPQANEGKNNSFNLSDLHCLLCNVCLEGVIDIQRYELV
jgi:hypothetical protein